MCDFVFFFLFSCLALFFYLIVDLSRTDREGGKEIKPRKKNAATMPVVQRLEGNEQPPSQDWIEGGWNNMTWLRARSKRSLQSHACS